MTTRTSEHVGRAFSMPRRWSIVAVFSAAAIVVDAADLLAQGTFFVGGVLDTSAFTFDAGTRVTQRPNETLPDRTLAMGGIIRTAQLTDPIDVPFGFTPDASTELRLQFGKVELNATAHADAGTGHSGSSNFRSDAEFRGGWQDKFAIIPNNPSFNERMATVDVLIEIQGTLDASLPNSVFDSPSGFVGRAEARYDLELSLGGEVRVAGGRRERRFNQTPEQNADIVVTQDGELNLPMIFVVERRVPLGLNQSGGSLPIDVIFSLSAEALASGSGNDGIVGGFFGASVSDLSAEFLGISNIRVDDGPVLTLADVSTTSASGFDYLTGGVTDVFKEEEEEEEPDGFHWVNSQGGSFEIGDNWSGGEKPGSQDTAHFNAPGSYTVDVGTEIVDRLVIGGDPSFNVTFQTLLLTAGSTALDEPSIQVNNGHFTLGGGFLTGNHMVIGTSAGTDVTVTGSEGVNGTLGLTGRLSVGGGGEAMLRVEKGGSVSSQESLIGTAENGAPGHVVVDGLGSSWNAGALVVGATSEGSLEILGGGEVQADSVHVGSENTPGRLTVQGTAGTESSTLNVTNDLAVGEIGSQSELRVLEGGSVHGGGSLSVFFNSSVVVDGAGEGESVLSADSGLTIGNFSSMTITNGGVFLTGGTSGIGFAGPGDLLVDGDQSAFFAKELEVGHGTEFGEISGTVTAANSGSVIIDSTLLIHDEGTLDTQTGGVAVGGSFLPGDLLDGRVLVAENGTVAGTGTILGTLDNIGGVNNLAGTVAPGASPGVLTIEGNYTQGPAGTLEIEIAGTTPGVEQDQLVVTGDALVEGNVVLKFIGGFAPTSGEVFGALLDVRGEADVSQANLIVQNLAGGFEFDITPMDSGLMFTALTAGTFRQEIDGDYDNSGQVEQGDLDFVLLNWGASASPVPAGWINGLPVGTIDQAELDGVLLNWGRAASLGASSGAVPEPSTLLLCVPLVAGLTLLHSNDEKPPVKQATAPAR